jgi:glycosyltransferase involved in cell wall biosynthesis
VKQGFLIPVYNHGRTAGPLAARLAVLGLQVIMVDDGSGPDTKACLAEAAKMPGIALVTLEKNLGKGGAVSRGIEKAAELGLTHVLQIDADGQHDETRISFFLKESAGKPDRVICGYPEYDGSAPRGRIIGRKISNFWVSVVTLSGEFRDALCGFRVYPVAPLLRIIRRSRLDKRMGFDPEILARLYWAGVFPAFYPVKVNYPEGGVSNFHILRDNLRISWMFTRLFFGMIPRLPLLMRLRRERGKNRT